MNDPDAIIYKLRQFIFDIYFPVGKNDIFVTRSTRSEAREFIYES